MINPLKLAVIRSFLESCIHLEAPQYRKRHSSTGVSSAKSYQAWLGAGILALLREAEEVECAQLVEKSQFQQILETTKRKEPGPLLRCTVGI